VADDEAVEARARDGTHDNDVAAYLARHLLDGIDRRTGKHVTARFRDVSALEHASKPFAGLGFRGRLDLLGRLRQCEALRQTADRKRIEGVHRVELAVQSLREDYGCSQDLPVETYGLGARMRRVDRRQNPRALVRLRRLHEQHWHGSETQQ